jgi:hypothetical protein
MSNRERDLAGLHPASVAGSLLAGRVDGGPAATDAEPVTEPERASWSRRLTATLARRRGAAAAARARRGFEPG